ncbi:MAG TPA: AAA family ATPase [Candidatus Acidoferrum sp.]|nr:AAA family ATPase [Candidatus Acidoferrum sp.]
MPVFLQKVVLQNYKSIETCSVSLHPLTLLVGPNGAGKSNFVDALRLVSDSLRTTLEHALRERGGIKEVRRRSRGHPTHFGIRLDLLLQGRISASYAFEVGALPKGAFRVQREECYVLKSNQESIASFFVVENGVLKDASTEMRSKVEPDRLFLTVVSALSEFRLVYDSLSRMGFYNLNPEKIRELQEPDAGELLARDGSNITSVLRRLRSDDITKVRRIEQYLEAVVPGIVSVEPRQLGPKETLLFRQRVVGDKNPWQFMASSMSDGTLRVLGVLVSALQANGKLRATVPLVGIEEPELAVHPGATSVLLDALREASTRTQVLLTTHSPDLLDNERITPDMILSVSSNLGVTRIAEVDSATRASIRDRLYTAGELLRLGQIEPSSDALNRVPRQINLFGPPLDHAQHNNSNR